ncbi:MAG: AI-2E family transporter [Desulfobacterales bacterium]|jgi:predicted PurR-regulated permease PerM|nr:AI-2E family transporter [Desulfobacterales bacterium]
MMGWLLWPFISVIILAIVVTGIFIPVYKLLNRKFNPTVASLLTCVLIFFVLFLPLSFFVGILANEAWDLYLTARGALQSKPIMELLEKSDIFETINQFLARFKIEITGEQLNSAIAEVGRVVGLFLYEQARSITTNVLKFIVNFFFMLLIIFYLLIDSERLVSFIVKLSPLPEDQDQKLIQKFKDIATAILLGNGLGGLIQGILGGIVFALFGLKSPFLWGVIMVLLAFLPILGIGGVFVPAAILLFLQGRIGAGIFFLIFYIILSSSIEYFFKPRLVGKRVRMHSLIVFLSIIGGLKLFGILGIIYGPLVVTAFLTLAEIYQASYQQLVESAK